MPVLMTSVKIELMEAIFTPQGGSAIKLGPTEKGSKLDPKLGITEIKVHELGDTPVDLRANGYRLMVELTLKSSSVDNIIMALAAQKTTVVGPPQKVSGDLNPTAGWQLPYGVLRLHPADMADADVSRDWTIHRAQVFPDPSLEHVGDNPLLVPIKFLATVFQDPSTGKVKLATYGDKTTAVDFTMPNV